MLPPSLVNNEGFRDFISYLDPSFNIPTRSKIKDTGMPSLKGVVQNEIKEVLKNIDYVNISTDLWTDATVRPFNGYICQGIDNDWILHCIPIEFDYQGGNVTIFCLFICIYLYMYLPFVSFYNGNINIHIEVITLYCIVVILHFLLGRHTGEQIKSSYDRVVKFYDVTNKVFKIVTDQGSNMKKGFRNEKECDQDDDIIKLTNDLLLQQKKIDLQIKRDMLQKQYEEEIEQMNTVDKEDNEDKLYKKRSREQVLADLCASEDEDENTETISDGDDSLLDADKLCDVFEDFKENEISKQY